MPSFLQKHPYWFLFFLSAAVLLAANWLVPVTDPSESNYALTAREMLSSGDWMSPRIYGNFWYDKPIFFYWELLVSFSLFGFNEFAARFPAALFGTASVLFTFWFASRVYNRTVGLRAALLLGSSLEFWYLSKTVITDAALFFFMSVTIAAFYLGYTENRKYYWLCYLFAALAALTKGPIGLLLPGLACFLFLLSKKDLKEMLRVHLVSGLVLFALVAGSWYGYMYVHHGRDFILNFFGVHNYLRATVAEHENHSVWYFYILIFFAGFFPWSAALPISLLAKWRKRLLSFAGMSDATRLLLIWAATVTLVFQMFATKYLTYTYPALFAVAILTARLWKETDGRRIALVAAAAFTLYTGLGFLVVPGLVRPYSGKAIADYLETQETKDATLLFYTDYSASAVFYSGRTMYMLDSRAEIEKLRPGGLSWDAKNVFPFYAKEDLSPDAHYLIFIPQKREDAFRQEYKTGWEKLGTVGGYEVYESCRP